MPRKKQKPDGICDSFKLAQARLECAASQIKELHLRAQELARSGEFDLVTEIREGQSGHKNIKKSLDPNKPLAIELGLIFGEAIHQLRSACDNVVYGFFLARGLPAGTQLRSVAFPVTSQMNGEDFKDSFEAWSARFLPPKQIGDLLLSLQPFNAYSEREWLLFARGLHPLRVLDDLWNYDKHQSPLALSVAHVDTISRFGGIKISGPVKDTIINVQLGEKNARILMEKSGGTNFPGEKSVRMTFQPDHTAGEIRVEPVIDIRLSQPGFSYDGLPALALVKHLHSFVTHEVIGKFFAVASNL